MAQDSGRRFQLLVAIVGLTFLHFSLRPVFDEWVARPNLLVGAVLIGALRLRPGAAAGVGFILGLLEDSMAVTNFGVATLLLVLVGFLGARIRDQFVGEEPLFMGTYLFVGTWVYQVAIYLILGVGAGALSFVFVRAPLDSIATGVAGYLVLPWVRGR